MQVKHTSNKFYGGSIKDVERFPSTLQRYKFKKGIFITNGEYPNNLQKIIEQITLTNNQVIIQWLDLKGLYYLYETVHS